MPDKSPEPADAHLKTARLAAMDMLARREHSAFELQQKLVAKFPDLDTDTVILPTIARLQEQKLQSDSRFAQALVRYRSQRGMGPLKIMAELRPRGLSGEVLREALYGDIDWVVLCGEVLEKKFPVNRSASPAEKAKWQRFLAQRGFDGEQCRIAIRRFGNPNTDEY